MRQAQEAEFDLSLRFAAQAAETRALDASTEFSRQANALEGEFGKLKGQLALDALPEYEKRLGQLEGEIGKGLKSPLAQRAYQNRAAQFRTSSLQTLGVYAANQGEAASEAADIAAIQAAQSRFASHFGLAPTEPDIAEIVSLSARRAARLGLPKEAADVLVQKNAGDALNQVIGVRVFTGHAAEAKAIFEEAATSKIPGTDLPIFSGEQLVATGLFIKRAEEAEALDKIQAEQRAHAAAEGERRKTQDEFLKRMQGGTLTAKDVLASNLDPFGSGSKEQFLGMLKVGVSGGEMKTNNELYIELFNRIHAPDDFPGKITDENELNQYFGSGLNATSLSQLRGEISGRRTQEGSVESDLKKNFLDAAKGQISGSNPLLGIADPKGDEQYYRFLSYFLTAYDKAVRAGGNPAELLDPDGELAKSIGRFKREPAQWTADLQAGAAPAAPGPTPPGINIPIAPAPKLPQGGGVMRMGLSPFPQGMIAPGTSQLDLTDGGLQEMAVANVKGEGIYLIPSRIEAEGAFDPLERYKRTKEHFGKFDTEENARAAAKRLTRPKVQFSPSRRQYRWQDQSGEWHYSDTAPRL
jgi:hypothetical protein